jgi:hypothetical protein
MQDKLLFNDTHNNNVLVLRRLHVAMAAMVLSTILRATTLESIGTIANRHHISTRLNASSLKPYIPCQQLAHKCGVRWREEIAALILQQYFFALRDNQG